MRRALPLSVAIVLLVGLVGLGGTAATAEHDSEVTIDGTVTGTDGNPPGEAVVLVGEDATLRAHSPDELRPLAENDPSNLTVVEVDDDGSFEATLESRRAEAALAVSDAGVSELVSVRGENATLDLQLSERRPQTIHEHMGAVMADERRGDLFVNLVNNGDTTVEDLSVTVTSLPDGWGVAEVQTDGTYHPDNRTITWSSVAPGDEVDTTVVVTVPRNSSLGEYTIELDAESATHPVSTDPVTVAVRSTDTPGPTTSPGPGGDPGTPTTDAPGSEASPTPHGDPGTPTTDATPATGSGPGFGFGVALAVLAALAGVLAWRR